MKKLILMTSALTLIGGAAAAEIKVSAEASVSYGNWETAGGAAVFDFDSGLTFALKETYGDLTWGAEITVDGDAATVDDGVIWVSGGFGKVSFGIDEFDEVAAADDTVADINGEFGDNDAGDVKYEGTFGAVGVVLVADAGLGNAPSGATWNLGLTYTGGNFSAGLETDSTNAWELELSTEFSGTKVGAGFDDTNAWDVWVSRDFGAVNAKLSYDDTDEVGLDLSGSAGDIAWTLGGDSNGGADASLTYTMAPWVAKITYDNDDAGTVGADYGDEADLQVSLTYTANDMLEFGVMANDQSEYEISMTAKFAF